MDIEILNSKKLSELREIAKTFQIKNYEKMRKAELIQAIAQPGGARQTPPVEQSAAPEGKESVSASEAAADASAKQKAATRRKPGRPPKKEPVPVADSASVCAVHYRGDLAPAERKTPGIQPDV